MHGGLGGLDQVALRVATAEYVRRVVHPKSVQFDPRVIPDTREVDVLTALPCLRRDAGVVKAITNVLGGAGWPLDRGDVCMETDAD